MTRPFESDAPTVLASLVAASEDEIVGVLRRVLRDLARLEQSPMQSGGDAYRFASASRAIHVALVELSLPQ
jgi:hypothetical protein